MEGMKFYTTDAIIKLLCLCFFMVMLSTKSDSEIIRGPPRVQTIQLKSIVAARLGQEFRVNCPIEGNPNPIVDWLKDSESITPAWSRFRFKAITRTLKIRPVLSEDSGIYECKGVNGFGSQLAKMRIVTVEDAFIQGNELKDYKEPSFIMESNSNGNRKKPQELPNSSPSHRNGGIPSFSRETLEQASSLLHLSSGNTIRLRCETKGTPTPKVTWFKDGKQIGDKLWKWSSWTLMLNKLSTEDSGTYECVSMNSYGKITSVTQLHVSDIVEKKKPELASGYPTNMTVLVGNEAVLECIVHPGVTSLPPHIKWLKLISSENQTEDQINSSINERTNRKNRLLPVANAHVLVIQETLDDGVRINETQVNGTYVSKLIIARPGLNDEGIYLCLATNSQGYTFREARLSVLQGAEVISTSDATIPFPIVVIGLSISVAFLVLGFAYFLRRYREKSKSNSKTITPRKISPQSIDSSSTSFHHRSSKDPCEQRQLLVSTTSTHSSSSSSSDRGSRFSEHLHHHHCSHPASNPIEPPIEIPMSRCSCCLVDQFSEVTLPHAPRSTFSRVYEPCYNNSYIGSSNSSLHFGHWT